MSGIKGLFRVALGETIKSPTIDRADVADGTKGRALLLSEDWLAAAVAYTDEPSSKRCILCNRRRCCKSMDYRLEFITLPY